MYDVNPVLESKLLRIRNVQDQIRIIAYSNVMKLHIDCNAQIDNKLVTFVFIFLLLNIYSPKCC